MTAPGPVVWPLADHLGTIRDLAVFDAQSGETTIANHRVFDCFGNRTSESNPTADCAFQYTGRLFDADTGLQYNHFRWYDPAVGRWLSTDPTGFAAGDTNLNRYVGNDPLNYTDPSGLHNQPQPYTPSGSGTGTEGPGGAGGHVGIDDGLEDEDKEKEKEREKEREKDREREKEGGPGGDEGGDEGRGPVERGHLGFTDAPSHVVLDSWGEYAKMLATANEWNKTSPGSNLGLFERAGGREYYMCLEQAVELRNKLFETSGKLQYWKLTVEGQYSGVNWPDNIYSLAWCSRANAIKLTPTNGNPWPVLVLYPYKFWNGPAPVQSYTWDEFTRLYPYKLY